MFKNFVFKPQYGMAINYVLGILCFLLSGVSLVFTILAFCYFFAGGAIGGITSIKNFNEETKFINEKLKQISLENSQNALGGDLEGQLEGQIEYKKNDEKIDYSKIDKKIKRDARSYKMSLMFSVIINCLVIYISVCSLFRLFKFLLF